MAKGEKRRSPFFLHLYFSSSLKRRWKKEGTWVLWEYVHQKRSFNKEQETYSSRHTHTTITFIKRYHVLVLTIRELEEKKISLKRETKISMIRFTFRSPPIEPPIRSKLSHSFIHSLFTFDLSLTTLHLLSSSFVCLFVSFIYLSSPIHSFP